MPSALQSTGEVFNGLCCIAGYAGRMHSSSSRCAMHSGGQRRSGNDLAQLQRKLTVAMCCGYQNSLGRSCHGSARWSDRLLQLCTGLQTLAHEGMRTWVQSIIIISRPSPHVPLTDRRGASAACSSLETKLSC